MIDMEGLADKLVERALKLGATDCDVLVVDSSIVVAEMERSSVKQASMVSDAGVAIRAFREGSSGFSCCTGHDLGRASKAVELAVSQARAGTPDPLFRGLPGQEKIRQGKGLADRSVSELRPDEVVEMAIRLTEAAKTDDRIYSVNAVITAGRCSVALANSNGLSRTQSLTALEMGAESVAKSGDVMFSGMDASWSRRLDEKELERVGQSASASALRGLRRTRLPTGDYPVVLDPLAAGFIVTAAIGGGANADSVQRKRSYLDGKLGKVIGRESLTVLDDPTLEWSPGSFSFDGEGTAARRKKVIDHGVLKSLLHDSYTAGKEGVRSTGNSSRGGAIWSFRRPPSIASSDMVVAPGDSTLDEILEETKRGVYLRVTYDFPNLATGEFSALMMESFLIEDGAISDSLQQSTMGIGLFEMFDRIDLVGKKTRYAFGARVPHIRVSKARIGGSG